MIAPRRRDPPPWFSSWHKRLRPQVRILHPTLSLNVSRFATRWIRTFDIGTVALPVWRLVQVGHSVFLGLYHPCHLCLLFLHLVLLAGLAVDWERSSLDTPSWCNLPSPQPQHLTLEVDGASSSSADMAEANCFCPPKGILALTTMSLVLVNPTTSGTSTRTSRGCCHDRG